MNPFNPDVFPTASLYTNIYVLTLIWIIFENYPRCKKKSIFFQDFKNPPHADTVAEKFGRSVIRVQPTSVVHITTELPSWVTF